MDSKTVESIYKMFTLEAHEGQDKVTSLGDAVREHVRPGMNLYLMIESGAAIYELIRQFAGTRPNFAFTVIGILENGINLVHCGLAGRLIVSNCSHGYPSPGLSGIVQKAFKRGEIEIENWTLNTHFQRLMAGAMGLEFLPTKSIVGSTMAEENRDSFLAIDDPFGSGNKVGLVKALNPDVAFVHGWAADRNGNTIGLPMSSQAATDINMWGAKASKNGAIVTVERLVSTDFIREHSSLVTLPGYLVKAVCHTPFGAHPQGMVSPIPGLFDSYAPDYQFSIEHRNACQDPATIDSWIREWVLDCRNQDEYVLKLGTERVKLLQDKASKDYWKRDLQALVEKASEDVPPNETESMILVAAQEVVERVRHNNYRILLGGVGAGMLSSWIAYYLLKEIGYHDVELVVGTGSFGFAPRPGDSYYGTYSNLHSCKAFFNTSDMYGCFIPGNNKSSLSILGAAQIDKLGNINTTRLKGSFLMGSGGANDAVNASETLIVVKQSRARFVDKVPYVTCPGRNVKLIVTDMGVFQKVDDEQEFRLVACLSGPKGMGLHDKIERVKENCGWHVKVVDEVKEYPAPGGKALFWLRLFDPERLVLDG